MKFIKDLDHATLVQWSAMFGASIFWLALISLVLGLIYLGIRATNLAIFKFKETTKQNEGRLWWIGFDDPTEALMMINRTILIPDLIGAPHHWINKARGLYGIIMIGWEPVHVCINWECIMTDHTELSPGRYKIRNTNRPNFLELIPLN